MSSTSQPTFELDRSHNEPEREARLARETPDSVQARWGRDVWMMLLSYELEHAGFSDAVAYNVPGTDNRRYELLGYDSPGEFTYEFDRRLLGQFTFDDLARNVIWWVRRSAALRGLDYRRWELPMMSERTKRKLRARYGHDDSMARERDEG